MWFYNNLQVQVTCCKYFKDCYFMLKVNTNCFVNKKQMCGPLLFKNDHNSDGFSFLTLKDRKQTECVNCSHVCSEAYLCYSVKKFCHSKIHLVESIFCMVLPYMILRIVCTQESIQLTSFFLFFYHSKRVKGR